MKPHVNLIHPKPGHESRAADNSKLCENKGRRVMDLQLERQSRFDGKVRRKPGLPHQPYNANLVKTRDAKSWV
jgi:hypothetical protein